MITSPYHQAQVLALLATQILSFLAIWSSKALVFNFLDKILPYDIEFQ
jgi:hypothetical protein